MALREAPIGDACMGSAGGPDPPRALHAAQVMMFGEAEGDCDAALARERSVKTLLRRATARRGKRDLDGARRDFKAALDLEPNNRRARAADHSPCSALGLLGRPHVIAESYACHERSRAPRKPSIVADCYTCNERFRAPQKASVRCRMLRMQRAEV